MTILVFGIGGLLGRAFVGPGIVGPSRAEVDIRSRASVVGAIEIVKPLRIINAAAYTAVDAAEKDDRRAFAVNAEGAEIVARAAYDKGIPLVHVSTDYVFGNPISSVVLTESAPTGPINAYGRTKLLGEVYARAECPGIAIIRTSALYSALTGAGIVESAYQLIRAGSIAIIPQVFSPTAVEDLAAACRVVGPGLWHFAGPPAARIEVANFIIRESGCHAKIRLISSLGPAFAPRPLNSALDSRRFTEAFGHTARPWQDGVRSAIKALA